MKKIIRILLVSIMLSADTIFAQQYIKKADFDGDGINDMVYLDTVDYRIICKLSTQNFKPVKSKPLELVNNETAVTLTASGFTVNAGFMRAGYSSQFRFNNKTKKMQLIGMSRYEFGPANNDGSGESSINLLTNNYIGRWNYYDLRKEKLIPLPVIKNKMNLGTVNLETLAMKLILITDRFVPTFLISIKK